MKKCYLIGTLWNKFGRCYFLIKLRRKINKKHLGLKLDVKLTFNDHIISTLTIVDKLTYTLRKLYHYIPRDSLVTIYKSSIRAHLDYINFIFDKPSNAVFSKWIESAHYKSCFSDNRSHKRYIWKKNWNLELRT